jgi:hypothetical protein
VLPDTGRPAPLLARRRHAGGAQPAPVEVTDLRVTGPDGGATALVAADAAVPAAGARRRAAARAPGTHSAGRHGRAAGCPAYRAAANGRDVLNARRPDVITSWLTVSRNASVAANMEVRMVESVRADSRQDAQSVRLG